MQCYINVNLDEVSERKLGAKVSSRRSILDDAELKVSRKARVRNCFRKFITFLFSQVGVGALLLCYTILGAFVFIHLESANEAARRIFQVNQLRTTTVSQLWNVTYLYNVIDTVKWWQEVDRITQAFQTGIVREVQLGYNGADFKDPWSFPKALMYSLRIYTTIGSGNLTPRTAEGKVITCLYALFGIPLLLLYMANVGDLLATSFRNLYSSINRCKERLERSKLESRAKRNHGTVPRMVISVSNSSCNSDTVNNTEDVLRNTGMLMNFDIDGNERTSEKRCSVQQRSRKRQLARIPIFTCFTIFFCYITFGSIVFSSWESWNFVDGYYFCFVSLVTIGCADLVPGNTFDEQDDQETVQVKLILCFLYVLLGMALMAMCFHLTQERVFLYATRTDGVLNRHIVAGCYLSYHYSMVLDGIFTVVWYKIVFWHTVGDSKDDSISEMDEKLRALYKEVERVKKHRLEIVRIPLGCNIGSIKDSLLTSSTKEEGVSTPETEERYAKESQPFLSLTGKNAKVKQEYLIRKFGVVESCTVILIDGVSGQVINFQGNKHILEDPTGIQFPWKQQVGSEILKEDKLMACKEYKGLCQSQILEDGSNSADSQVSVPFSSIQGVIRGFFFAAYWCPPCRAFLSTLIDVYKRINGNEEKSKFEIIFVSSDRSQDSFDKFTSCMPWLAIPYEDKSRREKLTNIFDIKAIPTLIITDSKDEIITTEARSEINEDLEGLDFPWHSKLVEDLRDKHSSVLNHFLCLIYFIGDDENDGEKAETVLNPLVSEMNESEELEEAVQPRFFIATDSELAESLRIFIDLDESLTHLVIMDVPNFRYSVSTAKKSQDIFDDSYVRTFLDKFQKGQVQYCAFQTRFV